MSNIFNGFLDSLYSNALNPKGNFGDFQHASRTVNKNQFRLAPKVKFLYHVYFDFSPAIDSVLMSWKERHKMESGLMVKSVQLPTFNVNIETKKKYNRTKHIQTGISYEPIQMTFHDDNLGMMTGMLEAYFRYHYADAWGDEAKIRNSYSKTFSTSKTEMREGVDTVDIPGIGNQNFNTRSEVSVPTILKLGDNTYKGVEANQTLHGLNTRQTHPFFNHIQISQMTRKTYTTFIIVNPIIQSWNYGDMTYASSDPNELSVSFNYESVWISRGATKSGKGISGTSPTGFGDLSHYDVTPSPNSIYGGGGVSLTSVIGGAADIINGFTKTSGSGSMQNDLFDYGSSNEEMNWIKAIIGGVNIFQNAGQLTEAGVTEEILGVINGGVGDFYDNVVSGEGGFFGSDE